MKNDKYPLKILQLTEIVHQITELVEGLLFCLKAQSSVQTSYVYYEDSNEIDMYVTSADSLQDDNNNINYGILSAKGTAGESFNKFFL